MSAFDSLADEPRWVAWRSELRGGKPTKIPYAPRGGKAKADDPSTWGSRAAAEACAARIVNDSGGGIGIMLGDLGGDTHLAGIDLDSSLDADGLIKPWAAEILTVAGSYAEISPSGRGLKVFAYLPSAEVRPFLDRIGAPRGQWGTRRDVPGEDARDHGPAIEIYCAGRYFTVTMKRWPNAPDAIALLEDETLVRLASLIPPSKRSRALTGCGDNSRSATAFRRGAEMRKGGKTYEEMVDALRSDPDTAAWCREKGDLAGGRELRRIWEKAGCDDATVSLEDFYAYMPTHEYLFVLTRSLWPAGSVDARLAPVEARSPDGTPIKLKASRWLDQKRPVEQMIWAPGQPEVIANRLMVEGGWIERRGVNCYNLYLPPTISAGDATQAQRWLDHLRFLYPDEAEHILDWLAHRVQRPEEKINHALVLLGGQGIGKDTLLQPIAEAVGPWNFQETNPSQILGRFNGFVKSVILRVSEAHDLGDFDRFAFYEHLKLYTAAPPDTLRVDEKHVREYRVLNCCGVIITSNHEIGALYLPADDRRHFVALSRITKDHEWFQRDYWRDLHRWYQRGGSGHVVAFLRQRDLSGFDPKAPPRKTEAFWRIVNTDRPAEEGEIADIIDAMGKPDAFTLDSLIARADAVGADIATWLHDRKNRRQIPHRLNPCGYAPVRNSFADDGLWKILGRRQVVYARKSLTLRDQVAAAQRL
jgi:hypothetical protein